MPLVSDCLAYCLTQGLFACRTIIVGVSGGADSMCLLDILFAFSACEPDREKTDSPWIVAAHVNHGLRGKDSDADEERVRKYCEDRKIPYFSKKVDVAKIALDENIGIEEAGRLARYSFFRDIAKKYSSCGEKVNIAVAHHREDQAETILMNLFRGAGSDGLCGMRPQNLDIIRPLLFASKQDILSYLRENAIDFSEDASNQENTYSRNRWRNQILPLIAEVTQKDPILPLMNASEILSVDRDYFDEQILRIFHENTIVGGNGTCGLSCETLQKEHRAIASRLVRHLYSNRFASGKDLSYAHVSSILAITEAGSGGRRISLPHGRFAYVSAGVLSFEDLSDEHAGNEHTWMTHSGPLLLCDHANMEDIPLFDRKEMLPEVVSISKTSFQVERIFVENPMKVVYNSRAWYCPWEELEGAVIRTRRTGDWFSSAGSTGGKPLRRLLTDRKIPAFIRDRVILVARESRVLWIPGIGHSTGFVDNISQSKWDLTHTLDNAKATEPGGKKLVRITIQDNIH